ncbi:MAG: peptidase M3, partial [Roseovarius indicus]
MTNPLLDNWSTPHEIAPFDQIEDAHFAPAFETALTEARAEIAAIADDPADPSFANTIEALELAGKQLDKVLSVFFTVAGADTNPKRQELQRAFSPKLAAYSSEVYSNKALYQRIETLWEKRDTLDLSPEQERLLYLSRRSFVRAGAALEGAEEARMRDIMSRLAELGTAFTQNLLADESGWHMVLAEDELEGLPGFLVNAAREAGQEKGEDGPVIT